MTEITSHVRNWHVILRMKLKKEKSSEIEITEKNGED